ncbi:hypothetical protein Tco_0257020 [Tanacetum coccineum]
MKQSKNTEYDLGDTSTPEKQPQENMEDGTDAVDRENFEMSKGQIGLVEVIEDDDKEDENERHTEKRKHKELVYETIEEKYQNVLKEKTELEHLLKEYMEMDELFSGDEIGVGNDDGNEDGADNNEVDVAKENEATEMGIDAEKSVKEAAEEKEADKASEMRQAAKKEVAEKELAAAKKKEKVKKLAAAKKKEQAEKLAAAMKKEKRRQASSKQRTS